MSWLQVSDKKPAKERKISSVVKDSKAAVESKSKGNFLSSLSQNQKHGENIRHSRFCETRSKRKQPMAVASVVFSGGAQESQIPAVCDVADPEECETDLISKQETQEAASAEKLWMDYDVFTKCFKCVPASRCVPFSFLCCKQASFLLEVHFVCVLFSELCTSITNRTRTCAIRGTQLSR